MNLNRFPQLRILTRSPANGVASRSFIVVLLLFGLVLLSQPVSGARQEKQSGENRNSENRNSDKRNSDKRNSDKRSTDKRSGDNRSKSRKDSEYEPITFDDIKLETEAGDDYDSELITDEIKEFNKTKVQLRGFMLPGTKQDNIKIFFLVRDNQECCFGPNAAIHDCVLVVLKKGTETSFTVRPVTIEGDFRLKEFYQGRKTGRPSSIYLMKNCKVKK